MSLAANKASSKSNAPLAERLRPQTIAEVVGQRHLLGDGKPLANAIKAGVPHSMIFWGPPGVGKTTLARLLADAFNAEMIGLSAVMAGIKDIREAVERAQLTRDQFHALGDQGEWEFLRDPKVPSLLVHRRFSRTEY